MHTNNTSKLLAFRLARDVKRVEISGAYNHETQIWVGAGDGLVGGLTQPIPYQTHETIVTSNGTTILGNSDNIPDDHTVIVQDMTDYDVC
jgi:hypothetical protein